MEYEEAMNDEIFNLDKIETEDQWRHALELVESFMDCPPHSPEEEKLSKLVDLIVEYEKIVYPIDKPTEVDVKWFREDQEGE